MKFVEIYISNKIYHTEPISEKVIPPYKWMHIKAWARNKASGRKYNLVVVDKDAVKKEDPYPFYIEEAYNLWKRGWTITKIAAKYRKKYHYVKSELKSYEEKNNL